MYFHSSTRRLLPVSHCASPAHLRSNSHCKMDVAVCSFHHNSTDPKLHEAQASDGMCETGVKGTLINLNMFAHKHRCTREAVTDSCPVGTKGGTGLQMVQNADVISMFPKDCLAPITIQSTSSYSGAMKFAG